MSDHPRIYVGSLTDYNAGELHGTWVELDGKSFDDVQDEIQKMLDASPTVAFAPCESCGIPGDEHAYEMNALPWYSERHEYVSDGTIAEEYAIFDHDGFLGISLEEYDPVERAVAIADALADHGDAFAEFLSLNIVDDEDIEAAVTAFEEAYIGESSVWDYAYDYVNDCVFTADTPDTVRYYFDYTKYANDLVIGGDVIESGGHLFRNA